MPITTAVVRGMSSRLSGFIQSRKTFMAGDLTRVSYHSERDQRKENGGLFMLNGYSQQPRKEDSSIGTPALLVTICCYPQVTSILDKQKSYPKQPKWFTDEDFKVILKKIKEVS